MHYKTKLNLQPFPTRISTVGGGHNPIEGEGSFLCGLTQLVEFAPFKGDVVGSSPTAATLRAYFNGRMAVSKTAYGGSNPPAFGINWRLPKYTGAAGVQYRLDGALKNSDFISQPRKVALSRSPLHSKSVTCVIVVRGWPLCRKTLEASGYTVGATSTRRQCRIRDLKNGWPSRRCASIHYGATRA